MIDRVGSNLLSTPFKEFITLKSDLKRVERVLLHFRSTVVAMVPVLHIHLYDWFFWYTMASNGNCASSLALHLTSLEYAGPNIYRFLSSYPFFW
jgi:hypothetical protein